MSSNRVILTELGWDMTESPKNIFILSVPEQTNKIVIICPIQGRPSKRINISYKNLLSFDLVIKEIYKIYKPFKGKLDHKFFEGLEFVETKGKTAYYKIVVGS